MVGVAGFQAAAVDVDLVVDEFEVVLEFGEFGEDVGAMGFEEFQAVLLVAAAGGDEFGVLADGSDRHAGGPEAGADLDPVQVELVVAAAAAGGPVDGGDDQAGTFVVPQRVHAHPSPLGGLSNTDPGLARR